MDFPDWFDKVFGALDTNGNGLLQWRDYVYLAANQHFIVGPAPGSTIPTETADGCLQLKDLTITWDVSANLGVPNQWWVWAGTSPRLTKYRQIFRWASN